MGHYAQCYVVWGSHPGFPAFEVSTLLTGSRPRSSALVFTVEPPDAGLFLSPIFAEKETEESMNSEGHQVSGREEGRRMTCL